MSKNFATNPFDDSDVVIREKAVITPDRVEQGIETKAKKTGKKIERGAKDVGKKLGKLFGK